MTIIADPSGAARPTLGQPSAPDPATPAEEAVRVASRIAAEVLAQTPALAARISANEFTEIVTTALRSTVDQYKPTADERGPAWMTRYSCPSWCVLDHAGKDGEPGWHQGAAIAMDPPPLQNDESDCPAVPFVAARINQSNENPEIFGITTTLWLNLGDDTHELNVAEASRFIERLETFLPRLKAMRDRLAEASTGDRPRNEEAFQAWRSTPLAPVVDQLYDLCNAEGVRLVEADGPAAGTLTEGILVDASSSGPRSFVIPPRQSTGDTLRQLRRALTAKAPQ